MQEEEMEKRGVSCHCLERREVGAGDMTKTASGYICMHCGRPCDPVKNSEKDLDKRG